MDTRTSDGKKEVGVYLGLTFGLSAIFWALIISAGSLGVHGGAYVLALMWCPGVSALITRLIFQRNVRGEGWGLGQPRWLVLAYVLPIIYATVVYGLVWLTGLGGVDLGRFTTPVVTFLVMGTIQNVMAATGEELGWRGFLVPMLMRSKSFKQTAIISGITWAGWHVPLIIGADYNGGTPPWYSVLCFAVMVVAMGFPFAWLRLRSGSVWPAALLHASHNLFVQAFFDRVTVDTGPTKWLTGEFGAGLALAFIAIAWIFWRARVSVEEPNEAGVGRGAATPMADTVPVGR
ncbi:MAG TPA: CPBP family intramembrane glutamic endopeptidase [Gemmatimonadaceae bacterium]|nr:CPBP family intramembrane glutamic endopeptidase [Gemmatimonadaceae bacterium]